MSHSRDYRYSFLDLPRKCVVVGTRDPCIKGYLFSAMIINGMFPKRIVGLKFCHSFTDAQLILCKRSVQSLQYSMRMLVRQLQFGHLRFLMEWCLGLLFGNCDTLFDNSSYFVCMAHSSSCSVLSMHCGRPSSRLCRTVLYRDLLLVLI